MKSKHVKFFAVLVYVVTFLIMFGIIRKQSGEIDLQDTLYSDQQDRLENLEKAYNELYFKCERSLSKEVHYEKR